MYAAARKCLLIMGGWFFIQTSFAQQEPPLNHIPGNATQILQINPARLNELMKWEEMTKLSSFNQMQSKADGNDVIVQAFVNPGTTGINLQHPLYIFSKRDIRDKVWESYKGVTGKIADLPKFTAWALHMNKTISLTRPGRVKTILHKDLAFMWDTEYFVIVKDDLYRIREINGKEYSSLFPTSIAEPVFTQIEKSFAEGATAPTYDARMLALFRQGEAVTVWNKNNTGRNKASQLFSPVGAFAWVSEKGENISASVLRFENGRIRFSSQTWLEEKFNRLLAGSGKTPFNPELARRFNLDNSTGFLTLKLNMSNMQEFINMVLFPKNEEIRADMQKRNIHSEDIFTGLTGDLLIVMPRMVITPGKGVKPNLVFVLGIQQEANFARLRDAMLPRIKANDEQGFSTTDATGKYFVIGSNREAVMRFLAENAITPNKETMDEIARNPFMLRLKLGELFQSVLKAEEGRERYGAKEQALATMLEGVQYIHAQAGRYENGALLMDYELEFANKEDNGYRQFVLLLDKVFNTTFKRETMISADTTVTAIETIGAVSTKSATEKAVPIPPVIVLDEASPGRPRAVYTPRKKVTVKKKKN